MKDSRSRFGFRTPPFTREIAVNQMFTLPRLSEVVRALVDVVHGRGSGALIGPAGLGKTAILRAITDALPASRFRVRYTAITGLSKRDMCKEIAVTMGLPPAGAYNALVHKIQQSARAETDTDAVRPVLLIDDAHELRPDVLSMLRVLTNFDMDSRLVLSVVLAGQSPLAELLRKPEHEDIARRLVHYAVLGPLSRDEVQQYVAHRCAVAGSARVPFDDGSMDAIYEVGRGNLRATDLIASKSLDVAHRRERDTVDVTCVVEARAQLWP
jgi:type II secretory pathway predicted ATPase ExeA